MKQYLWLLSACVLMSACGKNNTDTTTPAASATTSPPAASQTVYRVYTEQSYPPFIMHSSAEEINGFEYDLLNEIAKRQGFQVKFTPYIWDGLFDTLNNGKADIVSSGITITEERKQKMSFSDPYFETETVLLLGKETQNIKKFADIRGKQISVKQGTFQDNLVQQYGGEPMYGDSSWLTVKNTIAKYSAATVGDFGVLSYFAKKYPDEGLKVVKDPSSVKEELGFVVRKDNTELQSKLNQGLQQMKADGTYQKLYQKWFGE